MLVVLAVPWLFAQFAPQSDDGVYPAIALSEAEVDAKVAELFGPGIDMKTVTAEDPKLARELLVAVNRPEIVQPANLLRLKAIGSAEVADRGALEARAELKAIWLTAAQAKSAQACRMARNPWHWP